LIATLRLHGEIGPNKDFSERTVRKFLDGTEFKSVSHLHLEIASTGGDCDESFGIYHILRSLPISISAEVAGPCQSGACVVLMSASFRRAKADANLMMHNAATDADALTGRLTASALVGYAADLRRMDARMVDLFAFRSGCDRSRLEREMANEDDTPLTTALELGMLHEVDGVASIADIKPSPAQAANWAAAEKTWEVLRTYEQQNY
jgi:ATP-dependent protease ClpP protease subunit